MRRIAICCFVFVPFAALAQGYGGRAGPMDAGQTPPGAPPPPMSPPMSPPVSPGPSPYPPAYGAAGAGQWGGQAAYGYGGTYMGDYQQAPGPRRPAPPLRLQGQWRNGLWYY
jgi:hypothetical protein